LERDAKKEGGGMWLEGRRKKVKRGQNQGRLSPRLLSILDELEFEGIRAKILVYRA